MFTKKDIEELFELADDAILYAPEWANEKYHYEEDLSKFREKLKNLGEGEAETGYAMLSDVDAQKEIIIGMKECEWFVDFEFEGLSKIIYDTMEKNGILFYKK